MKIIAFTGMPASGKTEAVQLAKDKGLAVIRMGDAVWEETQNQKKQLDAKSVGAVADTMRKHYGMDIWAKRTVEKLKTLPKQEIIVIDGVRNQEEITYFKQTFGKHFILIAIDATDELRRKRVLTRGRADDSTNLKDLQERDKREISWGIRNVIAEADVIIPNNGSLAVFRHQVTTVLQDLIETIP